MQLFSGDQPFTIFSGGQTGVDRAALNVALELGIHCGGWCPRGRRAEDGTIPAHYPLRETRSLAYPVRTRCNVRDADATLILTYGEPDRGTALTISFAKRLRKPYLVVDLNETADCDVIRQWIGTQAVQVLNVAGPRESSHPGISGQAAHVLRDVFRPLAALNSIANAPSFVNTSVLPKE